MRVRRVLNRSPGSEKFNSFGKMFVKCVDKRFSHNSKAIHHAFVVSFHVSFHFITSHEIVTVVDHLSIPSIGTIVVDYLSIPPIGTIVVEHLSVCPIGGIVVDHLSVCPILRVVDVVSTIVDGVGVFLSIVLHVSVVKPILAIVSIVHVSVVKSILGIAVGSNVHMPFADSIVTNSIVHILDSTVGSIVTRTVVGVAAFAVVDHSSIVQRELGWISMVG